MSTVNPLHQTERKAISAWKIASIFVGVAGILLGGFSFLNYKLNPLMFSGAEQAAAAAVLAGGRNIAISDANIDWRELRREHIKQMKDAPDILIFGGSRWQEATSAIGPTKRVYNAFVSNDHFEDMMAISELLYSTNKLPKILILSTRFSTFETLDRREWWWKSFSAEYRAMASRLSVPTPQWWETASFGKYAQLLAAGAVTAKLSKLTSDLPEWRATDKLGDTAMDVVGSDGALRFSEQRLKAANPAFAENDALQRAAADRTKILKIDRPLLAQLGTLLSFLKREGVQVYLVQTPYHPAYYNAIKGTAYFETLMEIEKEINIVGEKTGVIVAGSFDATKVGCTAQDYRDFNHSSVECLTRVVKQVSALAEVS